jgi:hypothetical protein
MKRRATFGVPKSRFDLTVSFAVVGEWVAQDL